MPDQNTAEKPPGWFEEFKGQLGGALGQLQSQNVNLQRQMAAQQAAAQARPNLPPATADTLQAVNESLLNRIVTEPVRVVQEVTATATQLASANFEKRLTEERQKMQDDRDSERFWSQFYGYHPDLTAVQNEVNAAFNATDPNAPASVRADLAAQFVRNKLAAVQQQAAEYDRRQREQSRMVAGTPGTGVGIGPATRQGDEILTSEESTAKAFAQHQAMKAKRQWGSIATPEYAEAAAKRQNMRQ